MSGVPALQNSSGAVLVLQPGLGTAGAGRFQVAGRGLGRSPARHSRPPISFLRFRSWFLRRLSFFRFVSLFGFCDPCRLLALQAYSPLLPLH